MMKKWAPLWREAHFQVKKYKAHQVRTCSDHFWKLHPIVARSTCGRNMYKTLQNTSVLEHFWKLRCSKSAHLDGALLEVEMFKKCTFGSQNVN